MTIEASLEHNPFHPSSVVRKLIDALNRPMMAIPIQPSDLTHQSTISQSGETWRRWFDSEYGSLK